MSRISRVSKQITASVERQEALERYRRWWIEDYSKNSATDESMAEQEYARRVSVSNFSEMPPEYQDAAIWGWDMWGTVSDGHVPQTATWEWGVTPWEDFYDLASKSLGYENLLVSGGDLVPTGEVAPEPIFLASGSDPPHTLTGIFDGWHRYDRRVGSDVSWVKTESTQVEGIPVSGL